MLPLHHDGLRVYGWNRTIYLLSCNQTPNHLASHTYFFWWKSQEFNLAKPIANRRVHLQ